MRTKVGEVLTADLADALAAEAERGYDLARAKRLRIKKAATNDKELVVAKLDAALYDEPTDEELRIVEEARSESAIPWSDVEAELES